MDESFPQGKFIGSVKLGPKGQIVIPKEVREMFGWQPGDTVLLMADDSRGVALQPFSYAETFWKAAKSAWQSDDKEEK